VPARLICGALIPVRMCGGANRAASTCIQTGVRFMRDGTVERRKALFEEAKEIIRREYPQDLELDQVARRLATSRRQLQRSFAEIGNTSFRSYVAEVRMQRALELLQDGSMPVRDVASSVGYRQPAQFAKTFRRHHGAPPSSFRGTAGSDNGRLH
jgi:AraC family transcriptional regulator, regulatory protein of adaptative response / methylphosphotriester-DNA alkyltransferase methyltransferase